jgi:uncharacterized protein (TIGR02246 family)
VTDSSEALHALIARYCQLCDDGRFTEFAALFADDAEFVVMGRTYRGRAAIADFMEDAQPPERRGKHLTANVVLDIDDAGGEASACTDYVFVGREAEAPGGFAITSVGRYHDEFRRGSDGAWRFARREIVFLGDEPTDAPAR